MKDRRNPPQKNEIEFTPRTLQQKLTTQALEHAITQKEIERIVYFDESEPFECLGPHFFKSERRIVIRAFLPRASCAWILRKADKSKKKYPMRKIHGTGLYQILFESEDKIFDYLLGYETEAGEVWEGHDPYAFSTAITDYDLHLFSEGNHLQTYDKFGAHKIKLKGIEGIHFAVWAPNARAVSVVGNFNHWREGVHPMTRVHYSGVWAIFIPDLKEGELYKYAINSGMDHQIRLKADPYAFAAELRPRTASVVTSLDRHTWKDELWIKERREGSFLNTPISIYEVHLGSWRRDQKKDWGFLDYRKLAHELAQHCKEIGYTHVELMPVMEHPFDLSWGYQVVSYYAPSSRFGKPEDFMYFIDYLHQNGIGVLLDWVPAHFPKDAHGLMDFDGREIYAYEGWKKAEHKDWGTLVFDYGRNEVRNFLIANALFWLDKYHVDGLRVDAVASILYLDYSRKPGEWETNRYGGNENLEAIHFMKRFNEIVHLKYPGVLTIAEESTAWPGVSRPTYLGGLGFSMKWNMGWMHDTLLYFSKDPVYRKYHQGLLTFSFLYAFTENFILPISHDEVVYGKRSLLEKMPGDDWQKFANARLFFGYMFGHPGKKVNFMTNDIGQRDEWNSEKSMDWHLMNYRPHQQLKRFIQDLHVLYKIHRAFYEIDFAPEGFEWIDFSDADSSVLSFIRWSWDRKQALIFTYNMTAVPRFRYRIGVPFKGFYEEILNSDAQVYGGSGLGNLGGIHSEEIPWHSKPNSMNVNMPPLAVTMFKYEVQG